MDAGVNRLIVGHAVSDCPSDASRLDTGLQSIPETPGAPDKALADCGHADKAVIQRLGEQRPGLDLYVSVHREDAHAQRRYDYRPPERMKKPKVIKDPVLLAMTDKLQTEEGKKIYRQRACTVEPVFGIIKAVLGFRQFLLRGMEPGVPGLQPETAAPAGREVETGAGGLKTRPARAKPKNRTATIEKAPTGSTDLSSRRHRSNPSSKPSGRLPPYFTSHLSQVRQAPNDHSPLPAGGTCGEPPAASRPRHRCIFPWC